MFSRKIFTQEQELFRETVSRFIKKEIVPYHSIWENDGVVPKDIWLMAGDAGILCPNVSSQYGGVNGDFRFNVIITEELAKAGATGPGFAVHSDIVAPYIINYCNEEQKKNILPSMVKGETITAIAMTEPGTGSDLQNIKTKALVEGDKIILNGSKTFITNGQNANLILVVAKTDISKKAKGISIVICESNRDGFKRGKNLKKIGMRAQDTSELFF